MLCTNVWCEEPTCQGCNSQKKKKNQQFLFAGDRVRPLSFFPVLITQLILQRGLFAIVWKKTAQMNWHDSIGARIPGNNWDKCPSFPHIFACDRNVCPALHIGPKFVTFSLFLFMAKCWKVGYCSVPYNVNLISETVQACTVSQSSMVSRSVRVQCGSPITKDRDFCAKLPVHHQYSLGPAAASLHPGSYTSHSALVCVRLYIFICIMQMRIRIRFACNNLYQSAVTIGPR